MKEISADIRLRPIRIGFLVRPTDLASIRQIMRYCAAVWGGIYNPIIPVFAKPPKEWVEAYGNVRGLNVAKGYIRFFEPDVYVEAEPGLLEQVGLGALNEKRAIYPNVRLLSELLKPEQHRDWCDPAFGLNVQDVHAHLYRTEQQFARRRKQENVIVKPDPNSCVSEAIFGVFPTQRSVRHIAQGYRDVFQPVELDPSPQAWERMIKGAIVPLRVTAHSIDQQRFWHHEPVIFVFDPKRPPDLIDAWNLRLEPNPVAHIPVDWFEALGPVIYSMVKAEHRRIQGNPQNLMRHATIEFSRSIQQARAEALLRTLKPGLPPGALVAKYWRNQIWVDHRDDHLVHRDRRMMITAARRSMKLQLRDDKRDTSFETLSPEFARRYGGHDHRWVNALTVSSHDASIASVLPFNSTDPSWPRLGLGGERVLVGGEGWIFVQRYKDTSEWVKFPSPEEALFGTLKRHGIEAKLSEPGHIAKQMLEHIGGLWGIHLLADSATLMLLNSMAMGVRKRIADEAVTEESFELRTASLKRWNDLIAKRAQQRRLPLLDLEAFTSRNIIRLGLETRCPNCQAQNWTSLKIVDYEIVCERCLKAYPFPQAQLKEQNRNWSYRVVGPFSVPDYGRGSYGALLTLRLLDRFGTAMGEMTFITATSMSFDGQHAEADFLALKRPQNHDYEAEPELLIGEAKSFGTGQLIEAKDLAKLKAIASKLPRSIIVVSVLRDHFLPAEKVLLKRLVAWGRRLDSNRESSHPVLLLTAKELMFDHLLSATWQELGGQHAKFASYDHTHNLRGIADATQQIYLGLPSVGAERHAKWAKRAKLRPVKAATR